VSDAADVDVAANVCMSVHREAMGVIRKLFSRYLAATQQAAQRSNDAYKHYVTALANFDKLMPSPQKNTQQKRLHVIVNQQSTIMCSSLQTVENISTSLETIKELLLNERKADDYNFHESNPVHFFPECLQKFFSNPILSPSKMKLMEKKLHKKKRPKKKKKKKSAARGGGGGGDGGDIFDISDDDDVIVPETTVRELFVDDRVESSTRQSIVSRHSFTDQVSVSSSRNVSQKDVQTTESIQGDMYITCCEDVDGAVPVTMPSFVSRQSFTDQVSVSSHNNISQHNRTTDESIREQDVVNSPQNICRKHLDQVVCTEEAVAKRGVLATEPSPVGIIVQESSESTPLRDNDDGNTDTASPSPSPSPHSQEEEHVEQEEEDIKHDIRAGRDRGRDRDGAAECGAAGTGMETVVRDVGSAAAAGGGGSSDSDILLLTSLNFTATKSGRDF
jgi:hypothetical protein